MTSEVMDSIPSAVHDLVHGEPAGSTPALRPAPPALAEAARALAALARDGGKALDPPSLVPRDRPLDAEPATARVLGAFGGTGGPWLVQPLNVLRIVLHPEGLQPYLVNFDEVATELLTGLHRKVASEGADPERDALLAELMSLTGVPAAGVVPDLSRPPNPVLPLHLKRDGLELRLFTAVTQIASPQDVTLEGVRIESFMPADPASEAAIRRLADAG
jgi:hypothetical protein